MAEAGQHLRTASCPLPWGPPGGGGVLMALPGDSCGRTAACANALRPSNTTPNTAPYGCAPKCRLPLVTGPDGAVRLTPTEWKILRLLLATPGRLVPGKQMLREIWGSDAEHHSNYLRVYLAGLRRKLEPDPARPRHLITEPGIGYRFEP